MLCEVLAFVRRYKRETLYFLLYLMSVQQLRNFSIHET